MRSYVHTGEQNEELRANFQYYATLYPFLEPEFCNKGLSVCNAVEVNRIRFPK